VPDPGPGQLLLRVLACGVCRTDLHLLDGEVEIAHPPRILGHQIVARVEPDGPRVGVPWLGWTCGECAYCRSGRENLCPRARFTGRDVDGGFAEYAVADERFCFPIPDGFPDDQAAPLLCAGLIGYRCLRILRSPPVPGCSPCSPGASDAAAGPAYVTLATSTWTRAFGRPSRRTPPWMAHLQGKVSRQHRRGRRDGNGRRGRREQARAGGELLLRRCLGGLRRSSTSAATAADASPVTGRRGSGAIPGRACCSATSGRASGAGRPQLGRPDSAGPVRRQRRRVQFAGALRRLQPLEGRAVARTAGHCRVIISHAPVPGVVGPSPSAPSRAAGYGRRE
jgi:hypothetical protein